MTNRVRIVLVAAVLSLVFASVATASTGDTYPLAVVVRGAVHTVSAGDGVILVRRWDERRRRFENVVRQEEKSLAGHAIAVDIAREGAIAFLVTERYQRYELWLLDLKASAPRAHRVWQAVTDATLYDLDASPDAYVISGDNDVVRVAAGKGCSRSVTDRIATTSLYRDGIVIADSEGLSRLPHSLCDGSTARLLSVAHGHAVSAMEVSGGSVAIIQSGWRRLLVSLDRDFRVVGLIPLTPSGAWRLSRVGRLVVASSPHQAEAYEVNAGVLRRLEFADTIRGYVSPSDGTASVAVTDGTKVVHITRGERTDWRKPLNVFGVYLDAPIVTAYGAAAVLAFVVLVSDLRAALRRR